MPQFTKLTPNLIVDNIDRSLQFYEQVLGLTRGFVVPEQPPFVFASVNGGSIEVFLNDRAAVIKDHPEHVNRLGVTMANQLFIEVASGIDSWWDELKSRVKVVMPLVTQWYGMKEFAIEDPDGHVIIFAERVQQ
jgi:lactoylglutathione lyase